MWINDIPYILHLGVDAEWMRVWCGCVGVWVEGWYLTSKPCKSSQIKSLLAQKLHWYISARSILVAFIVLFVHAPWLIYVLFYIRQWKVSWPGMSQLEQEAHGPYCSPEKPVQINKHICAKLWNISLHWLWEENYLFLNNWMFFICKTVSPFYPWMLSAKLV